MNEQFCKDLAHTFGIHIGRAKLHALAFHDNDGHEWILECAPQSEILFLLFVSTNEPDQINKILEINNNREMLGMFFLSLKDDKTLLNIAFPKNKIDITEFTNLMGKRISTKKRNNKTTFTLIYLLFTLEVIIWTGWWHPFSPYFTKTTVLYP